MARLILSLDGQVLTEHPLLGERHRIGRLPDNDIRIDHPAVSGHHSVLIRILGDAFLEDLNSTNGTYVNGKLIKKHALQHGDVITVGHHQLRFVHNALAAQEADEFERTMIISPNSTAGDAPAAHADAITARGRGDATMRLPDGRAATLPPRAKLQVLSGAFAGRELELSRTLTTLGRPGVQVAAVTRRADGYFIVHVDSGQPGDYPLVNGRSIGEQACRLNDNDVILLAGVKMGFFES